MQGHRPISLLILGLMMVTAGCGDSSGSEPSKIEIADEQLIPQISTWVNNLGLAQTDPVVWRQRLERACTEGVWEREVARRLAQEFINEDQVVSVRAEGLDPPSVEDGAQSLWIMAVNVCRDLFPNGEIEDGPPSP